MPPPRPPDDRRCTGTNKKTGKRCGNWLRIGEVVCKYHGGNTPRTRAKAWARRTEILVNELVATYGLPIETTAIDALLGEVKWTAGHVAWLRTKVQEIENDNDLVWGVTEEVDRRATEFDGTDTTRKAAVNVWLKLYQDERTHLVKVCSEAIRCGIEERQVRIAEQLGSELVGKINQILDALDLSPEQLAKVPQVVPAILRSG